MRDLGKEFCDILFLKAGRNLAEAVVAQKKHILLIDPCAEGGCIHELHRECGGHLGQIELLEAGRLCEINNGIGANLDRIFLCEMVECEAQSSITTPHLDHIYGLEAETLHMG